MYDLFYTIKNFFVKQKLDVVEKFFTYPQARTGRNAKEDVEITWGSATCHDTGNEIVSILLEGKKEELNKESVKEQVSSILDSLAWEQN